MQRNRVSAPPTAPTGEDKRSVTDQQDDTAGRELPPAGLAEAQIEEISRLLREGKRLPSFLIPNLFDVPREYELAYAGKVRSSDVLAETMAVPLQAVRTFDVPPEGWSNTLVFGDNLQVLRRLLKMKDDGQLRNADGTDGVRLCYIDPPFATRREFAGPREERAYLDRVEGAAFVEALRQRLILIHELLSSDGSLYVHLDSRKSHYIKVVLDEIFGEAKFEREIVWRIGWISGYKSAANNWIRNHDTLLYYRRGDTKVFNKDYLPYPEDYVRRDGSEPTGQGVPIEDTWNCNPADRLDSIQIMSFSGEKTGFPTQKNRNLLDRIIRASSNEGDIVLDAFVGSGTTAVVAEKLKRRWIAIDSAKYAIYTTQRELLRLPQSERSAGFTLYNAGLYDYQAVRSLDWPAYRRFVLDLFQVRDNPHDLGGVVLDGYLGDEAALVYDFRAAPEATIGSEYVADLRRLAGEGLGSRCFIIAPAVLVEPYEDYLDVDGTRFFFLRIPYSVIAQIHSRKFSELRQPDAEGLTNALVDSVGFDFIQPPKVRCDYQVTAEGIEVVIQEFQSRAYARPAQETGPISDLAMVMVDADYGGEILDVDLVFWADDLMKLDWRLRIDSDLVGSRLMFVYLDVFGNEYREVKDRGAFATVPAAVEQVRE